MQLDRREFVFRVFGSTTLSALAGCGGSRGSGGGGGSQHTKSADATITFDDSEQFYQQLSQAISRGQEVTLRFDGVHRISRQSRLMTEFIDPPAKPEMPYCPTNRVELYREFSKMEKTADGREQLRQLFADDLLEHEVVKDQIKLANGEVIEPLTVMLVVLVILAVASVAHAEIISDRRYRIGVRGKIPGAEIELFIQGEP